MSTINRYRFFCETEQEMQTVLLDEGSLPTACPNDPSHVIGSESITLIESINDVLKDSDGASYTRPKSAPRGWTYQLRGVELETSVLDSIYNQNGTEQLTDATISFFNDQDIELTTQGEIDTNCVKTIIDLHPPYDYEIVGGFIRCLNKATASIRVNVVAVPDVPFEMGGSRYMVQSLNLEYLSEGDSIVINGRAPKRLNYDSNFGTNKLRFIFTHSIGYKQKLHIGLEHFRF